MRETFKSSLYLFVENVNNLNKGIKPYNKFFILYKNIIYYCIFL